MAQENKKTLEALKRVKQFIQTEIDSLKDGAVTTMDDPPKKDCPEGQIRNAAGKCVDDIG